MFVRRASYANGSTTLISWIRPTYDKMYHGETRFVTPNPYRVYKYDSDI
jgi:hypothetical protein